MSVVCDFTNEFSSVINMGFRVPYFFQITVFVTTMIMVRVQVVLFR